MSEEFFRLPSKGKTPLHEKLYTNAYGAYCLTRGFFVEFLYVFLFFLRYGKEKRCAQSHHFGINNFAHALARHGAERMSQGMLAQLGGQALSVALSNKPAQTREIFGQAYGLGVGVGIMLPYSRSHESEADHIGLVLMAKAGYDPAEAVDFWKRMEAATGGSGGGSGLAAYMSTHPANVKRVEQIQSWLPEVKSRYYRP